MPRSRDAQQSLRPGSHTPTYLAVYIGLTFFVILILFLSLFRSDLESDQRGVLNLHQSVPRTILEAGRLIDAEGWMMVSLVLAMLATALTATAVLGIGNITPASLPKRDAVIGVVDTFVFIATLIAVVPLSGFYFAITTGNVNNAVLGFTASGLIWCASVLSKASRTLAESDVRLLHDDEAFTSARLQNDMKTLVRVRDGLIAKGVTGISPLRSFTNALVSTLGFIVLAAVLIALVAALVPAPASSWQSWVDRMWEAELRVFAAALLLILIGTVAWLPARIAYWRGVRLRAGQTQESADRIHRLELIAQVVLPFILLVLLVVELMPLFSAPPERSRSWVLLVVVLIVMALAMLYDGKRSWRVFSMQMVLREVKKQVHYEESHLKTVQVAGKMSETE